MKLPVYLDIFNEDPHCFAHFITRIPGLPTSTNRNEMLKALEPFHRAELEALGTPWTLLRRAQQVHGAQVAVVGDIGCHYPISQIDGMVCSGVADCCLGIYVADCAAVWIYDPVSNARGLVHSGKVGTELNIVAVAVKKLKDYCNAVPSRCIAIISPCIRPPHYEVDLPSKITEQLIAAGLEVKNIHDSGLDTASDLEFFYSYRIEKGNTGRMLALFGKKSLINFI